MMNLKPAALGGCVLFACSSISFAQEAQYTRDSEGWLRTEPSGQTYRVDATTISVKFAAPLTDLESFRTALGGAAAPFAELQTVRSNKLGIHDLAVPAGTDALELVAELRATGRTEFAEENTIGTYIGTPNDPSFSSQWHLANTGQTGGNSGADINADLAWNIEAGDPSVIIAVLDSGTQINHPDLADNVWVNATEIAGNGVDDDGNGFIDDVNGWNFEDDDNNPTTSFFHGTFVAGMAAARTNNSNQISGVAGGFNGPGCSILPCAVGEFGPLGSVLDDAIIYAADQGARVITLSLTVPQATAIDMAVDYAVNVRGVFVDCASGNFPPVVGYPALLPDIYAIGSTNHNDQVSSFSGSGPEVFVVAPGEDVVSLNLGGGTTVSSGTSFAAPTVAGIAGLLFSYQPSLTAASAAEVIRITARDIGPVGFDNGAGWGRADAFIALRELLLNDCDGNGVYDPQEIADGSAADTNGNGIPDSCEGPTNYCTALPNSTGVAGSISSTGSTSVAANDLDLSASNCPPAVVGIFVYAPTQGSIPLGDGILCLTPPIARLPLTGTDALGNATFDFDNQNLPSASPALTPGTTWNFSYWFRDVPGGPAGFNLTDGLSASFSN